MRSMPLHLPPPHPRPLKVLVVADGYGGCFSRSIHQAKQNLGFFQQISLMTRYTELSITLHCKQQHKGKGVANRNRTRSPHYSLQGKQWCFSSSPFSGVLSSPLSLSTCSGKSSLWHLQGEWQQGGKNWKLVIRFTSCRGLIYSRLNAGKNPDLQVI